MVPWMHGTMGDKTRATLGPMKRSVTVLCVTESVEANSFQTLFE